MRISYNLLKEIINVDLPLDKQLGALTSIGLEVEGNTIYESILGSLEGVVVGKVLKCVKHPNADRLKITQVDVGDKNLLQIICGAPNVKEGAKVPVALVGTNLYNDKNQSFKILKSKIRGEISEGMICSEKELQLGESHEGIMILDEIHSVGKKCSEIYKIYKDNLIEIGLTPNRSDAMSHLGVARDLKAWCISNNIKYTFKIPKVKEYKLGGNSDFKINVENFETCPYYSGALISDIDVKPSPIWIQNYLTTIGISPKNNIVDITNFVMHELGQPLHAFDLSKIEDEIIVKTLPNNTTFVTLDGEERKLSKEDLMICDKSKPLCIAGIYGGINSGVTEKTKSIFLECALFNPISIRKTSKRHGLSTDASFRYERGVDPDLLNYALCRALDLILDLSGGKMDSTILKIEGRKSQLKKINFRYDKIYSTVGFKIPVSKINMILKSLDIKIISKSKNDLNIELPNYRNDVTREIDVIEEVIRIYGYNKIPSLSESKTHYPEENIKSYESINNIIVNQLIGLGFNEVVNNSIISPTPNNFKKEIDRSKLVEILNPIGTEISQMRNSLLFGLLENISYNLKRQEQNIKIFETGKVYLNDRGEFIENKYVSISLTGDFYNKNWIYKNQPNIFFKIKGIVNSILFKLGFDKCEEVVVNKNMFENSIEFRLGGKLIAMAGTVNLKKINYFDIHQQVAYAELELNKIFDFYSNKKFKVSPIRQLPFSKRDYAIMIDNDVDFNSLKEKSLKISGKLLYKIDLFDVYNGKELPKNKKSYGISFYFYNKEKTVTDSEINIICNKLEKMFIDSFGAELR
ncbi:MAG: phenylalanine--tRNA ligase subunit beta [Flavobacteriales bacterium TMED96]|nr:MAG: phenylalanine--tRNA ligase subunit beta [Flavobacteriales bacterium TMED96]